MVNGFAFLMCEQFVTHVTGTVTRMGLEWPVVGVAIEYAVVLASFVLGAAVAVIVIQSRARQGKQPRWAMPLVLGGCVNYGAGRPHDSLERSGD